MKLVLSMVMVVAACGGPAASANPLVPAASPRPTVGAFPAPSSSPTATAFARSPRPTHTLPPELQGSEAVHFQSLDAIDLDGRLFGSGPVGVVLAHGDVDDGEGSWYSFASALAGQGYFALTLDLRGFCPGGDNGCSGGTPSPPDTWRDVLGAARFLNAKGVPRVFLIGASLGARSSIWAASRPGVNVSGVIGISTPEYAVAAYRPGYDFTPAVIGAIHVPILLVAGDQDENLAAQATEMYGWANEPKKLAIVPSPSHGAALMQDPVASSMVLDFLQENGSNE
jgi:pimeloyl-ACP methyl ester carboxylesterase